MLLIAFEKNGIPDLEPLEVGTRPQTNHVENGSSETLKVRPAIPIFI